jgi:tol-pal system protein YbgF
VTRASLPVGLSAFVLVGCATRADLIDQDRRLQQQISEQRKQIQSMQREVERLRGDLEGGPKHSGPDDHVAELEERLSKLEGKKPEGDTGEPPPGERTAVATPTPPPQPPAAQPPPPAEDAWDHDVARDQQAIAASNAPERAELAPIMDGVARKDCARAVPQLNGFASQKKDSPLASNALYWAARCYALKGDRNQAISKFYDVVTKYPKGNKAPAALWEQGNLFIDIGDTPDARLAFSRLIRDYPSTDEAARARQKLSTL